MPVAAARTEILKAAEVLRDTRGEGSIIEIVWNSSTPGTPYANSVRLSSHLSVSPSNSTLPIVTRSAHALSYSARHPRCHRRRSTDQAQ